MGEPSTPRVRRVHYRNFKLLQDAELPLEPLTLLIGPNASGKTTALQGIEWFSTRYSFSEVVTLGEPRPGGVDVRFDFAPPFDQVTVVVEATVGAPSPSTRVLRPDASQPADSRRSNLLKSFGVFRLNPSVIGYDTRLVPRIKPDWTGAGLAGVLDRLRDDDPDRFRQFNDELRTWLPEFDAVLFETPSEGTRAIKLRRTHDKLTIPARALSEGSRLALAIMALGYVFDVPSFFAIEDPETGIHPRLLRQMHHSLYRLTHPAEFGLDVQAKQVILTTHSPLVLDLFHDDLDSVVIAQRHITNATFTRLSEIPHLLEILGETRLSDAWYTGVLGGVPSDT